MEHGERSHTGLNSVAHPLSSLPAELLYEIFSLAVGDSDVGAKCQLDLPPWNISQVSQRWRLISVATPALWCRISIGDEINDWKRRGKALSTLRTILSRSGPTMQVKFLPYPKDKRAKRIARNALGLLVARCHCWTTVDICVTSSRWLQILHWLKGRLPLLRELSISIPHPKIRFSQAPIIHCFSDCPSLKSVVLNSVLIDPPWSQLTKFNLEVLRGDIYKGKSLRFVMALLEPLTSPSVGGEAGEAGVEKAIHFPRVRSLRLCWASLPNKVNLSAPALEALDIYSLTLDSTNKLSLISHLGFQLRTLRISTWILPDHPDIINALILMPNLDTLSLINTYPGLPYRQCIGASFRSLMRHLTRMDCTVQKTHKFLPILRNLAVVNLFIPDVNLLADHQLCVNIVEMIQSRVDAGLVHAEIRVDKDYEAISLDNYASLLALSLERYV